MGRLPWSCSCLEGRHLWGKCQSPSEMKILWNQLRPKSVWKENLLKSMTTLCISIILWIHVPKNALTTKNIWMITFTSLPPMQNLPTLLLMGGNYFDNMANKDPNEKISMSNGKSVPLEIPCHWEIDTVSVPLWW